MRKPPIRVMPKNLYEHKRIQDLCRALYDYAYFYSDKHSIMLEWCREIIERVENIKKGE